MILLEDDPVEKPVPTFSDHALKPEVDEFAVLLDAEDAASEHRGRGVEIQRPQPRALQILADLPVLVIVAHDLLRVRREPGNRNIDRDEYGIGHLGAAERNVGGIGHLRQHRQRGCHAVGAEEHPGDDDAQEGEDERGKVRRLLEARRDFRPELLQA